MILYDGLETSPGNINHGGTCPSCGRRIEWRSNSCDVNGFAMYGICRLCEIKFLVVPTEVHVRELHGWEEPCEEEGEVGEERCDLPTTPEKLSDDRKLGTTISTHGTYTQENGRPEIKCDTIGRSTFFGLKEDDEVTGWFEIGTINDENSQPYRGMITMLCDWNEVNYAMVRTESGYRDMLLQDGDEISVQRRL